MPERQFDLKIRVKASDEASGVLGVVGSNLQRLGMVAIAGIGALTIGATLAGTQLIHLASDAEEMGSKFNVVFGEFAPEARRELEAFGDQVGRNTFELVEWAGAFQDTFVPMGFARGEAADLSRQLVELTVDVASFNNALEPDVARDFQSALVGNHETVRKYGIVITQVALDAELMRMGIEGGVEAATEQEKVMARLNLIMAGTSDAHGDAARTADSWANQMRSLKATLSEAATELGTRLLPAAKPVLGLVCELASWALPQLTSFLDANVIPALETFGAVMQGVGKNIGAGFPPLIALEHALLTAFGPDKAQAVAGLFTHIEFLRRAFVSLATGQVNELFDEMPVWAQALSELAVRVNELVAPIFQWITQNISLSDVLTGLGVAIGSVVIPIIGSLLSTIAPIIAVFAGVVLAVSLLRQAWETDFLGIRTALVDFWENSLLPAFGQIKAWFGRIIPPIIEKFQKMWTDNLQPAFQEVGRIWAEEVMPLFDGKPILTLEQVLGGLEWAINAVVDVIGFLALALQAFVAGAGAMINWFQQAQQDAAATGNAISGSLNGAWRSVVDFWSSTVKPPLDAVSAFFNDHMIPLFRAVGDVIRSIGELELRIMAGVWQNILLPAITAVWKFIDANVLPIFRAIGDFISTQFNAAMTTLAALWNHTLLPAIQAVSDYIDQKVRPIFEEIARVVREVIGGAFNWFKTTILDPTTASFRSIGGEIDKVTGMFNDLANKIDNLSLPPWLTPGSPTPFEMGLWGINDAMDELSRKQLPSLSRGFGIANPLQGAAAGANTSGQGAAGEMVQIVIPVTLDGRDVGYGTAEGTLDAFRQRGISLKGAAA